MAIVLKSYKTLKNSGKAQEKFKNSLFKAHAGPVVDEIEAKAFLKEIKGLCKDADHNVSAYIVKIEDLLIFKYDDNGEPAGSSGKPVFKLLESKELINAAVVISRYFGGTKLGFGGLSKAYRETALLALEDAGIIEVIEQSRFRVLLGYQESQTVRSLIEQYGHLDEEKYTENVEFIFSVETPLENTIIARITSETKNKIKIEKFW
jgi:uncharacterized YigZ family protein